jgi:hypothetical protein
LEIFEMVRSLLKAVVLSTVAALFATLSTFGMAADDIPDATVNFSGKAGAVGVTLTQVVRCASGHDYVQIRVSAFWASVAARSGTGESTTSRRWRTSAARRGDGGGGWTGVSGHRDAEPAQGGDAQVDQGASQAAVEGVAVQLSATRR